MATASVKSIIFYGFCSNSLILSARQKDIKQKVYFSKKAFKNTLKRVAMKISTVGIKVSERGEMKSGGHKKRRWRL